MHVILKCSGFKRLIDWIYIASRVQSAVFLCLCLYLCMCLYLCLPICASFSACAYPVLTRRQIPVQRSQELSGQSFSNLHRSMQVKEVKRTMIGQQFSIFRSRYSRSSMIPNLLEQLLENQMIIQHVTFRNTGSVSISPSQSQQPSGKELQTNRLCRTRMYALERDKVEAHPPSSSAHIQQISGEASEERLHCLVVLRLWDTAVRSSYGPLDPSSRCRSILAT